MLLSKIRSDIRTAMLSRDELRKNVLRVVVGEVQRKTGAESDEDVIRVIKKLIEGNNESISYNKDSRALTIENEILSTYLPEMWTVERIKMHFSVLSDTTIFDIVGAKNEGAAMGIAMKSLKSRNASVESKDVKTVVQELRSKS